jgi:sugar transferase (PEP-CTERM/EpsH1 system associated)
MKIVVLLSRVPYPLDKGDKLRAFHQIKQLSKNNEIILIALNDEPFHPKALDELKPYCKHIKFIQLSKVNLLHNLCNALFSKLPMQVGYFYGKKIRKIIDHEIKKQKPDLIYCQLIRMAEYCREIKEVPTLIDYMDVFSKGIERRINKVPFYLKPIFKMEYRRLLKYEGDVLDDFTYKTIISVQDRNFINHPKRNEIAVIPNGVDTGYFHPLVREKKYDILFCGNMSYPPNIDSAVYLVEDILPRLLPTHPNIKILIAGATPSPKVMALQSNNVTIAGWIDDIRESFAESKMLVAPMQISIGLQNKLLQAMAMKIPVITSVLANNAIHAIPNESILVAENLNEYVSHIIVLLDNKEKADNLAENAFQFINTNFTWEAMNESLERLIHSHK